MKSDKTPSKNNSEKSHIISFMIIDIVKDFENPEKTN